MLRGTERQNIRPVAIGTDLRAITLIVTMRRLVAAVASRPGDCPHRSASSKSVLIDGEREQTPVQEPLT
jgi:hypothetical protein